MREPIVYVVDDDPGVRHSLTELLSAAHHRVKAYASAAEFLDAFDDASPGCLVLDVRMPDMNGIELQEHLRGGDVRIPVIFVTAFGEVESAVRAMKAGAIYFLQKPLRPRELLDYVKEALALDAQTRATRATRAAVHARLDVLTPREREVMALLVEGKSPKEIGVDLGLSHKTVHIHRANLLRKLKIDSIAQLVKFAAAAGMNGQLPDH